MLVKDRLIYEYCTQMAITITVTVTKTIERLVKIYILKIIQIVLIIIFTALGHRPICSISCNVRVSSSSPGRKAYKGYKIGVFINIYYKVTSKRDI